MDLSLLGGAWASDRTDKERVAAATVAVVGVMALDLLCGRQLSDEDDHDGYGKARGSAAARSMEDEQWSGAVHVRKSITINRPAEELYRFWRDFDNLPRFMTHLEEIRKLDDKRSHWKAKGPVGFTFEWDAEITEDRPNERLAWASVPGSSVHNAGSVTFKQGPGGRGTVVEVECGSILRRRHRGEDRQAVRQGAGPASERPSARLQADYGNRRSHPVGRQLRPDQASRPARRRGCRRNWRRNCRS